MKFILFDEENGRILGWNVEDENKIANPSNNRIWYTVSEEGYKSGIKDNRLVVNLNDTELTKRISDFDKHREEYKTLDMKELPVVVELEDLVNKHSVVSIDEVRANKCRKNSIYCNQYIEFGINVKLDNERVRFSYSEIDQLNWAELYQLILHNEVADGAVIPVKPVDYDEYVFIDKDTFVSIYKKLTRNKYYQLFYLRAFNDYVYSIEDINTIERLQYETVLSDDVMNKIETQLKDLGL